jgi:hypothetical protein
MTATRGTRAKPPATMRRLSASTGRSVLNSAAQRADV